MTLVLLVVIVGFLLVLGVAPTPTARVDPAGIKLEDGYRSLITIAADTNVEFWEKSITPPGLDGGDPIDTTTMHNDVYRTMAPRGLKTMTPVTVVAAYDPIVYSSVLPLIDVETTITITWRDGTTLAFYGFIQKFEQGELVEGELPEITLTIVPTNADPTTGAEEAAVLTNVPGS